MVGTVAALAKSLRGKPILTMTKSTSVNQLIVSHDIVPHVHEFTLRKPLDVKAMT